MKALKHYLEVLIHLAQVVSVCTKTKPIYSNMYQIKSIHQFINISSKVSCWYLWNTK